MMEGKQFTRESIMKYLIKKYPDCCFASNYKPSRHYDDDELIDDLIGFFYYEKLEWCGCGNPEAAQKAIKDYLNILNEFHIYDGPVQEAGINMRKSMEKAFGVENIYQNTLLLCFAYSLDAAGLTEHGTGISGAWPTDEGLMFLYLLNIKYK